MTTAILQHSIANQKAYIGYEINRAGYYCARSAIPYQWLVWKTGESRNSARRFRLAWSQEKGWSFYPEDKCMDREAVRLVAIAKLSAMVALLDCP